MAVMVALGVGRAAEVAEAARVTQEVIGRAPVPGLMRPRSRYIKVNRLEQVPGRIWTARELLEALHTCSVCGVSGRETTACRRCGQMACEAHYHYLGRRMYLCHTCADEVEECEGCGELHRRQDMRACDRCRGLMCDDCMPLLVEACRRCW